MSASKLYAWEYIATHLSTRNQIIKRNLTELKTIVLVNEAAIMRLVSPIRY